MKKINKIFVAAMAFSIGFGGNTGLASGVNYGSGFYKSTKTRNAYLALSPAQRAELDRMNTNNDKTLTIKEVEASGKWTFPIYKNKDWIYPFMIDRDRDGMVGENNQGISGSVPKNEIVSEPKSNTNDVEEDLELANPVDDAETSDLIEDESNDDSLGLLAGIDDTIDDEGEIVDRKARLTKSIEEAKLQIGAVKLLFAEYPETVKNVREKLEDLVVKAEKLIARGEAALLTLE